MAISKKIIFQLCQFSIFFMKISWIGPWVSRIDWFEGHWWGCLLFSALWMVSSESWKILHSIYYAHDCMYLENMGPVMPSSWAFSKSNLLAARISGSFLMSKSAIIEIISALSALVKDASVRLPLRAGTKKNHEYSKLLI